MHVTRITKKKSHEFEKEQERAYGRVWGKKGKGLMILKEIEITYVFLLQGLLFTSKQEWPFSSKFAYLFLYITSTPTELVLPHSFSLEY